MIRTRFNASEASDTPFFPVNKLLTWKLPLRIMAPPAMKRTPLEEHRRPDTWTIVRGKSYYIENCSNSLFDTILTIHMLI